MFGKITGVFRDRLMVGLQNLDLPILVRIQVPEQNDKLGGQQMAHLDGHVKV